MLPREAMGKKNGKPGNPSGDENTEKPKEDIILKANMHCDGCAKKVLNSLRGFDGVEEVETDCKTNKVIVKGEKADPLIVFERLKKKYGNHVDLISPIPKPQHPQQVQKKEEKQEPKVMIVVMKVYMHCDKCAVDIKKAILKMKGVRTVEVDTKESTIRVKGVFDPPKLVDDLHNRAGKHAIILKQEEEKKPKKKDKAVKETTKKSDHDTKEGIEEFWGNQNDPTFFYSHYQHLYYPYQCFSDENPNACNIV